jgi:hypothetical protein
VRVEKTLTKKAQDVTEPVVAANPTLKLNVKRPSASSGPNHATNGLEPTPVVVRAKDFVQSTPVERPRSAMKNGNKRQPKPESREVNSEILDAFEEESNTLPNPGKLKRVKIVHVDKPSLVTPKIRLSNPEVAAPPSTPKPTNPLKRKLEIDIARINNAELHVAPSASIPATPSQVESAVPPFNVKRLTEKGWTADRTPFKRVRASKLLRDLSEKYRVLVSLMCIE